MPPRRKAADEAVALPGVMEAQRRRRRRRRSRRRRSRSRSRRRSRSRSRSLSQGQGKQAASSGSSSPRRKTRTTKYGNVNPFMNFMTSERARMAAAGLTAAEVARELGARWRAMPLEERQPYIAQAIKSQEELERTSQGSNIVQAARRRMRRRRRSRGRRRRSRSRSRSRRRR